MTRITCAFCLAFGLIAMTGCQNYLRVEVQLLQAGGTERVTEATLPAAIEKSMAALDSFEDLLQALEDSLAPRGQWIRISGVARDDRAKAEGLKEAGRELRDKLGDAAAEDVYHLSFTVHAYVYDVADFCTSRRSQYRDALIYGMDESEARRELLSVFASVWDEGISDVQSKALSGTAEAAGFGGFTGVAAHQIDASDPRYAQVVKARPIGRPFTLVESAVTGDSTVMFVQESPTQLRAFSVDMDPTQLVHNIIYIADKALQAASRMVETGL